MPLIRDIHQRFWRLPQLPWLELRTTSESRQAYKRHSHPQLSLGAIIAGETRCISNEQEYLLRPGELILIPPQSPHSCNPLHERPRSYHILYLDADWCLTQLPHLPANSRLHTTQPQLQNPQLFQLYQQIVTSITQQQTAGLPALIIHLLRALPLQSADAEPPCAISRQLVARLVSNLQEPPTLDTLAQEFALRKETLIRTFKQDTGLTPVSFTNMARIEYARHRLRAGDDIADVAYQTGFADQSHFHKTFVSYTAATPRQYAQNRSISDNK
ncbi:AraC family transcriptional regulator [Salmonella enterica]|nr:AraC family transcriptional regulator [Salmonella enterica]EDV9254929.1 AraC family transcriptional regulator [Salmonella enterica subsp. enterica serovar Sundsvall]EBN6677333.1 AraC family transcriptional regulator [Salmonella enterica]EDO5197384.1 helix-turn-helix domain-containing protein [Salmonella enterica]EDT9978658.1 AraC family transcriptional regulator [Salmonella enterica]